MGVESIPGARPMKETVPPSLPYPPLSLRPGVSPPLPSASSPSKSISAGKGTRLLQLTPLRPESLGLRYSSFLIN